MNKVRKAYGRLDTTKERAAFIVGVLLALGLVLLVAAAVVSELGFAGLFAGLGMFAFFGVVLWVIFTLADSDL